MKPIEISHILDNYLKTYNKEGKFIVRKKVEQFKTIPSVRTIVLELYYCKDKNIRVLEVRKTSNPSREESDTSILCEELICKILTDLDKINDAIQ
jgi:hypothetical protein